MNEPDDLALIYRDLAKEISELVEQALARLTRETIEEISRCKQKADPVDMAKCYARYRIAKEAIEEALKPVSKTFEVLKSRDLPELLEERDMANVPCTDEDIQRVISPSARVFVACGSSDTDPMRKKRCMEWLRNHQDGETPDGEPIYPYRDLITETVNANTLASTAKHLAKDGKEFPAYVTDDKGRRVKDENGLDIQLFETGTKDSIGWRKIPKKL